MELLGHKIDATTNSSIVNRHVHMGMKNEIKNWLKNPNAYNLPSCSNNPHTRMVLEAFQDIQRRTGATSIKIIEYLYILEQRLEKLEQT